MMTDAIADMLTRVRNANTIERPAVDMPATKFKVNIAQVLKEEGFIIDYQIGMLVKDEQGHTTLQPATDMSVAHITLRVSEVWPRRGACDSSHSTRQPSRPSALLGTLGSQAGPRRPRYLRYQHEQGRDE